MFQFQVLEGLVILQLVLLDSFVLHLMESRLRKWQQCCSVAYQNQRHNRMQIYLFARVLRDGEQLVPAVDLIRLTHRLIWRLLFYPNSNGYLNKRCEKEVNRFLYSLYLAFVDLEELRSGKLDMWPIFSSRTPWSFTSILSKDHCINSPTGTKTPLRERVLQAIYSSTGQKLSTTTRIYLLTGLRIFGVEFNPVSFYFVCDGDSREVDFVVAEVNNIPWFEQHLYVLTPQQVVEQGCDMRQFQGHPKAFHVSPFIDMANIRYSWLIANPDQELRMKIGLERNDVSFFMAGLHAYRHSFSAYNLLKFQITKPLQSCKVIVAIMWEAGKLFRRGFVFVPHPNNAETTASKAIASAVRFFTSVRARLFGRDVAYA